MVDHDYDTFGRLATVTLPSGEVRTYQYDIVDGNLASITSDDPGLTGDEVTLAFTYDGSLPEDETWSGAGLASATVGRTYDSDYRVDGLQVGSEPQVSFVYDADGLLTQAGSLTLTPRVADGLLGTTAIDDGVGNSVSDALGYTAFGELDTYDAEHDASGTITDLYSAVYTRDALGRITSKNERIEGATAELFEYRYDTAGRLDQVKKDSVVVAEYHYDANGNRIAPSFNTRGTITTAPYDDQDRLTTLTQGPTTTTYTYTDNGELLTKTDPSGTETYDYDARGNLRSATLSDGTSIDYVIDGQDRRIGKKVNGTLVQQLVYKDQLNPVAEYDGAGNLTAQFIYASKPNVPDTMIKYDHPTTGTDTTYRIISDHLGSVRLVVDVATGTVEQQIDYDEFGIVLTDTNAGFQPFGFAGGIYDADTHFVRFGARDYDAILGRWTAKDPIGFNGRDVNMFRYVGGDPVGRIDPGGAQWDLTTTVMAFGVGSAIKELADISFTRFAIGLVLDRRADTVCPRQLLQAALIAQAIETSLDAVVSAVGFITGAWALRGVQVTATGLQQLVVGAYAGVFRPAKGVGALVAWSRAPRNWADAAESFGGSGPVPVAECRRAAGI